MAETFPRWGLSDVEFVTTDPATIQAEILTKYEEASGRTLASGDPVRIFLLSIADIIIQQRACINTAAQQNLLSYAQGVNLDALGNNIATERLQDSSAVTTIRFTLSQSLAEVFTIPSGFEVTNGTVTFATNTELQIAAGQLTGEVAATCTTAGAAGNDYLAGQISTIVSPITFLASATNTTITSGGADSESDAEYAERIRLAPNAFSVAGPTKAYQFHAYSVSSAIIDVGVDSPSPGVVKVYPLLEGGTLPTAEVLDQIEAYLSSDDIRPLTDDVEALAPAAVNYAINIDFWINKSDLTIADSIRTAVDAAVEEYRIWQQGKIGRDITPDQLICKVMAAGAARIDFATLSPASWQELQAGQVAQCTGVTVTYNGTKDE